MALVTKQGRQNAIDSIKRIAEFAQKKNVTLGLEVVNRYESNC
jgi:D-psicose/D-tagatose/L-ribulose 3-epimerase